MTATDRVGQQIRATQAARCFRGGEWATVSAVLDDPSLGPLFLVEFLDGATDLWVVADPSDPYEFGDAL